MAWRRTAPSATRLLQPFKPAVRLEKHMTIWSECYEKAITTIESEDSDLLFYRGHADGSWKLLPTLARSEVSNPKNSEQVTFFDFQTRAGDLLSEGTSPWQVAFSMQHHGLPTRLLDWTESFATALYFALKSATNDACVWVLNPFELNELMINRVELIRPEDLKSNYEEYFISESAKLEGKCVAVSPLRHHPRVFRQRAGFTIHDDLREPLEEICSSALTKIEIPVSAHGEARQFLKLSGISEFLLFPDLDGLARELYEEHF